MKSLFAFRKVIVFSLLLVCCIPQYATAQIKPTLKGLEALMKQKPFRGGISWTKYKYIRPHSWEWRLNDPDPTVLLSSSAAVSPIINYEPPYKCVPAYLVQDQSLSNLNKESPTSIPSFTPELFNALVSVAEHPYPLYGTWRIKDWTDEIQKQGLITRDDADIRNLEYINISPDIASYHCGEHVVALSDFISCNRELDMTCNAVPQLTWIKENIIALDFHFENCSRRLILERIDHTVGLERAIKPMPANQEGMTLYLPQRLKGTNIETRQSYSNKLESKQKELSVPISAPINENDQRLDIKHKIEEQMNKLGIQIQFDFKEKDKVGFIIFTYGYEYKLDAA